MYNRVQLLHNQSLKDGLHNRSYLNIRSGIKYKAFVAGLGINFDQFGPTKMYSYDFGLFTRWEFKWYLLFGMMTKNKKQNIQDEHFQDIKSSKHSKNKEGNRWLEHFNYSLMEKWLNKKAKHTRRTFSRFCMHCFEALQILHAKIWGRENCMFCFLLWITLSPLPFPKALPTDQILQQLSSPT